MLGGEQGSGEQTIAKYRPSAWKILIEKMVSRKQFPLMLILKHASGSYGVGLRSV